MLLKQQHLNEQHNLLTAVTMCTIQSQVHNALQTFWLSIKIGLGPPFRETMDTSQSFYHTGGMQLFQPVGEWNSFAIASALQSLQTQYYDIIEFVSVCEKGDVMYCVFLFFSAHYEANILLALLESEKWDKRRNICQFFNFFFCKLWKTFSAFQR